MIFERYPKCITLCLSQDLRFDTLLHTSEIIKNPDKPTIFIHLQIIETFLLDLNVQ